MAESDLTAPAGTDNREAPQAMPNGRRAQRLRRQSRGDAQAPPDTAHDNGAVQDDVVAREASGKTGSRRDRRERRGDSGRRPRAPLAERASVAAADDDDRPATTDDTIQATESGVELPPPIIDRAVSKKRASRTARRARSKQQEALAAVNSLDADGENNPALGALNRHLNMMMQQLTTAHRVIGRVAAERDALRQQLADLQGIPVEEIVVSTIGASAEQQEKPTEPAQPLPKTGMARLNYFGGDDVAVMRRRRQTFVLGIVVIIVGLWLSAKMGAWTMPDNINRDSITRLPYIGDLMAYFLAGWMLFRLIRISSKGVKWVFPNEDKKRRRR